MKATLHFDLEDPFDVERYHRHCVCDKMTSILYDLVHGFHDFGGDDEESVRRGTVAAAVREQCQEHGVNFEEIWT